jgi:hypothetical protein
MERETIFSIRPACLLLLLFNKLFSRRKAWEEALLYDIIIITSWMMHKFESHTERERKL